MSLDSKSIARKMQKKSGASPSQRSLRSSSARTVLVSKENNMGNPKSTPRPRKESKRTGSHGSHRNSGTDSQSPVAPSTKLAGVLGEIKNSKKIINVGKRSTRTALKIYDYCETDPDTENRPQGGLKKKSQTEQTAASKAETASDPKRKRTSLSIPSKRKSVINTSHFFSGEKISPGIKKQNYTRVAKIIKTEPKLKGKSVLSEASSTTTKISVKPNVNISQHPEVIVKTVERKCASLSENSSDYRSTNPASDDLINNDSLNDLPGQFSSTPIMPRMPARSLCVTESVAKHSKPFDQYNNTNKICEDVSEAFVNLNSVEKHQEVDCSVELTESEELHEEVHHAEVHHEALYLGLTSTPEKNPSAEKPREYGPCVDSGMGDIVEVTLYDSPKKLSPIKMVAPPDPDSLVSDDSCYDDKDFESSQQGAGDGTPVKNDVEESVMKSFRAYHTPHQFRRHLFKKNSKKALQKKKSKSPAEVKLDLWASVMNDHFDDIEGSELVIE